MFQYDYLIVGYGLFDTVFARKIINIGKKCLVVEKRNDLGKNYYIENNNNNGSIR